VESAKADMIHLQAAAVAAAREKALIEADATAVAVQGVVRSGPRKKALIEADATAYAVQGVVRSGPAKSMPAAQKHKSQTPRRKVTIAQQQTSSQDDRSAPKPRALLLWLLPCLLAATVWMLNTSSASSGTALQSIANGSCLQVASRPLRFAPCKEIAHDLLIDGARRLYSEHHTRSLYLGSQHGQVCLDAYCIRCVARGDRNEAKIGLCAWSGFEPMQLSLAP